MGIFQILQVLIGNLLGFSNLNSMGQDPMSMTRNEEMHMNEISFPMWPNSFKSVTIISHWRLAGQISQIKTMKSKGWSSDFGWNEETGEMTGVKDKAVVIIIDPDMILLRPLTTDFSDSNVQL